MPTVFVPKERTPGETRVAATPETVKHMKKAGLRVLVEAGAGAEAYCLDAAYLEAGAELATDLAAAYGEADLVLKVRGPGPSDAVHGDEVAMLRPGAVLVGLLAPLQRPEVVGRLAARGASALAMELVPRITRAQKMDALSSQASIAGYKAVLVAAWRLPKYFPLLMTAAGTVKPARIVVMGAGVAGLQAIATARRLGAIVEASDVRPAVKEQVESLGGKFIEPPVTAESGEGHGGYAREVSAEYLKEQQRIVRQHVILADCVITTALVPGRKAPVLVTAETVEKMRPGSVIVDLAVEQGGNCELSVCGEDVVRHGVTIVGHPNLAATMPGDASMLYARNVWALVSEQVKEGKVVLHREDEVVKGCLVTHEGAVVHEATRKLCEAAP
ncbi:MAG: Re/Si-specific NAD(P)(+) transhydrogenase subunit alpha [Myxococcales bacterium]|nr:Re/Si-specific NAD(P)(+) transhydrogenase subunit alpha [Myxococcales bacterium]